MKKKLLISVITLGVIAALVAGGVIAYFTDEETTGPHTMDAGTIDISVDGVDPWEDSLVDYSILDMKPCDVQWMTFTITNVGTNEAEVWKHFEIVSTGQGVQSEPEREYEYQNGERWNIDSVIMYDLMVNHEEIITAGPDGLTLADVACKWIYLGKIEPGADMVVCQSYHMMAQTENWAQGDTLTFNIDLFAQQMRGCPTPPAPGEELADYGKPTDQTFVDIGNPLSELGHLNRDTDGWSYVGRNDQDGGLYLRHGNYGGYDGGSADFRGLMGPPTGCAGFEWAHLVFRTCDPVTQLVVRHLDGSQNDSFDVYYRLPPDPDWVYIGHYSWSGNTSENWLETTFDLPHPVIGKIEFSFNATDPVTSWCEEPAAGQGWGQVMFNWAQIQ